LTCSIVIEQIVGVGRNNNLGRRLRTLRHGAGLTQAQLAAMAGLSKATISEIECGAHIGAESAAKYAQALGYVLIVRKRYTLRPSLTASAAGSDG
jgi:transcriptional regulator with XRE-family HTH domain